MKLNSGAQMIEKHIKVMEFVEILLLGVLELQVFKMDRWTDRDGRLGPIFWRISTFQ